MKDSPSNKNTQLQITFPKSTEDHRLQLVGINGSIFAILHSPLESNGPINLDCKDWSLIILAPIKSKVAIDISAINIISFHEVESEEGIVNISASNRLVKLTPSTSENVHETAKNGTFELGDDPTTFLSYFRLFNGIVSRAQEKSPESIVEAQQRFLSSLCALAEKMDNKESLNIHRVLQIWDIAPLQQDN